MERDIWRVISSAIRRLPPTRPRGAVYTDPEVLAVVLWAVRHDRSINWACRREHWPMQAWRRALPDQSTISRRLRTLGFARALLRLIAKLQPAGAPARLAFLDGKAIMLGEFTTDPHARTGRGTGRYAIGYRLHALVDEQGRLLAWTVRPLNTAEQTVARRLLRTAHRRGLLAPRAVIVADAGYDSNPLHGTAREINVRLVAPRRKPGAGLGWRRHERGRLRSIRITERCPRLWRTLRGRRAGVERFFATLSWRGLYAAPPWVRRRHRTAIWVGAKLAIHAAAQSRLAQSRPPPDRHLPPLAA